MDDKFYEAFFHEPAKHVVLGRLLHPFCLQDVLKLMLLGSPFLSLDKVHDISWAELRLAVLACSTPLADFSAVTAARGWPLWKFRWWCWKTRKMDLAAEAEKFRLYVYDYYSLPDAWTSEGGGTIGAPWPLAIVTNLVMHSSVTLDQAWTMPIGEAIWLSASITEQRPETGYQIVSAEEAAAIAELQQ